MNYIIVYLEIKHLLNFLSQEEKGDFLDLLILYAETRKTPTIENKNVLNVFNFIKGRIDTQFEKAEIKAEIARKNGANGGRPQKPRRNLKKPKETQLVFNDEIEQLSESLKSILEAKLNRRLNTATWKQEIKKLLEIDLKERPNAFTDVKKVIAEINQRFGEQYFPVVQSASSLREKFSKIEAAIQRKQPVASQASSTYYDYILGGKK